jgi:hypothetical protein
MATAKYAERLFYYLVSFVGKKTKYNSTITNNIVAGCLLEPFLLH